ncbi:TetR/AcrR family transcriptional regulator [Allofournierella sp.]|uniref:TetR/AcrR family transcriptional regulator n=1 Tax=Allofournierella sp. TaxID=1940256 RepID=UPI003AB71788
MPPKAKITRQMILDTALELTRQAGFEAVNARSIAGKLQCSTRPLFTCYENMEQLKSEFLAFAYEYYERYVAAYRAGSRVGPGLLLPLSYVEFARQEPNLFRLLFISDMDLALHRPQDFYKERGNEKKAAAFARALDLDPERAKVVFLDLFLYTHGIAVLAATNKLTLGERDVENMVANVLSAFLQRQTPATRGSA